MNNPILWDSHRTFFFKTTSSRLERLEKEADSFPQDSFIFANYLRELNKRYPREVQRKFESGKYALNETAKREYIKAMIALKKFDKIQLEQLVNPSNTPTTPNPMASVYGGPLSVEVTKVRGLSFWLFALSALAFAGGVGVIVFLLSNATVKQEGAGGGGGEDKKSSGPLGIPVSNAHSQVTSVDVRFDDVKGIDEAKEEVREIVEYLRNPQKFTEMGAKLPKGILLMGEPGCGKTLMARAIAGEAGVPFLYCSGSAFDEMFVGVGPRRVRNLFADAKKLAPCIIFIDEIDAIGTARKFSLSASYAKESTLNQLLTELDGFQQTEGIILIGATNLPDALDPALVRPGRFDKQVHISAPDIKGRKEILDLYMQKTRIGPDVDSRVIARGTTGFTGADLSNLVNLAAIKATVQGKSFVDMRVFDDAKDDIIMGIRRKGVEQTEDDRKLTAYHEGGHALVALYTDGSTPLHKATIIQRGSALGMTVQLPEQDAVSFSRKQMMATLAVCMGGRAAEEIAVGDSEVTSGASSDIRKATQLAYSMVSRWGMSERVGKLYCEKDLMSEDQKKVVDEEVKKLLADSYDYALKLLKARESELHNVASALLEHETLTGEEISLVAQGQTILPKF